MAKKQNGKIRILIVDDEAPIRDMIKFNFAVHHEFVVSEAEKAKEARRKIELEVPDVVLLDWMLPDMSGIELGRSLKENPKTQDIPIIMLTAKAMEDDKITGLNMGADDYVVKPFSPRELIARIKAVLRRGLIKDPAGIAKINDLKIDTNNKKVTVREDSIKLNPIEYRLLEFFISHQDRVYSRQDLLNYVWGTGSYLEERTVDVQIRRLRKALSAYHYDKLIQTVRGSGYRFSQQQLDG